MISFKPKSPLPHQVCPHLYMAYHASPTLPFPNFNKGQTITKTNIIMKTNEKFRCLTVAVLGALAVSSCEKPKTNAPVSEFEFNTNSQIAYSNIQNLNIASLRGGSGCEEILALKPWKILNTP